MPFERPQQGFWFTRARPHGRAPRALLLVGTPGTGKRPLAHYLADELGYVHLDLDSDETREQFLGRRDSEVVADLEVFADQGRGVVMTWRAGPVEQLREIRRLKVLGVEPVWFDGDRGAACRAHYAGVRRPPRFRFVDTFEKDGSFRPVESVASDLLRRRRRRLPWPGASTGNPRLADGLAFLVGAAAATAAVLVAVYGGPGRSAHGTSRRSAVPVAHRIAALPREGVLVMGRSLAGVRLGDTQATVRALWGTHFTRCGGCEPVTWFFVYPPPSDPVGAAVEFRNGRVVAVYTLGSPRGWHTETGLRVGQIIENPTAQKGESGSRYLACAGYGAQSTRSSSGAVTSILTQGASVYGFALSVPSVSPCH